MGKGLQTVARSLDPSHRVGLLCGSAPDTRHVYLKTRLTQSKSHVIHAYTADGPAQWHNDHLALCWRAVDCRRNRCNRGLAEFQKKKVRLEVRNRRQKKSTRRLSFEIRHDLDSVVLRFQCSQRPDQIIPPPGIAAIAEIDFESWSPFGRQQLDDSVHFIPSPRKNSNEGLQKLWNPSRWIHQSSRQNLAYRMELIIQGRHHTEVAASTAN